MDLPGSSAPTHGGPFAWFAPLLVGALLLAWPRLAARRAGERIGLGLLAIAAVVSAANYVDMGRFRYGTYLNEWDVFHYYLGTKYADEVGYFGLYEAALVADDEGEQRYRNRQGVIRDLRTIEYEPVAAVLARRDRIRGRFSPERWRSFSREVAFFARSLPADRFSELLCDRGYNGTPFYTALVRTTLSGRFSVDTVPGRAALLGADVALLLLTFVVIGRTFGARAALVSMVFVGTHYLLSWGHLKGALVRTDFACCATLAVCALRAERPALAGGLVTWAACSRVFPALFVLGPLAQWMALYVRERRWDRTLSRFLVGAVGTGAAVVASSAAVLRDARPFTEWTQKILHHANDPTSWDLGYAVVLDAQTRHGVPHYEVLSQQFAEMPELRLERALSMGIVAFAVLVPTLAFATRLPRDRALALGYVFVFFLMPSSYYYALALLPLLLYFLRDPADAASNAGAALLLATGSFGYLLFSGYPPLSEFAMFRGHHQFFPTYYYMSCAVMAVCLYAVAVAGAEARRAERALTRPDPADAP